MYEDAHEAVLSIDDVHYAPPLWFERGLLGCDLGAEVLEGGQWRASVRVKSSNVGSPPVARPQQDSPKASEVVSEARVPVRPSGLAFFSS